MGQGGRNLRRAGQSDRRDRALFCGVCRRQQDGKTDIVAANESTTNVSVFIGDGTGNFGNKGLSNRFKGRIPSLRPISMATATSISSSPQQPRCDDRTLTGVGDGSFNAPKTTSLGTPNTSLPYQIAIGDINGDSRPDVVSAIYADQQIGITYNANGLFGTTTKLAASGFHAAWQSVISMAMAPPTLSAPTPPTAASLSAKIEVAPRQLPAGGLPAPGNYLSADEKPAIACALMRQFSRFRRRNVITIDSDSAPRILFYGRLSL